jgi:hypothetical protein
MAFSASKEDTRTRLAANRAGMHAVILINFFVLFHQDNSHIKIILIILIQHRTQRANIKLSNRIRMEFTADRFTKFETITSIRNSLFPSQKNSILFSFSYLNKNDITVRLCDVLRYQSYSLPLEDLKFLVPKIGR